jgi:hypothetical protein
MLYTYYQGKGDVVRYACRGERIVHGGQSCIPFAGARPEQRVVAEILRAGEGRAIEAALRAAERTANQKKIRMEALSLELEQARYQARLAERRYQSSDPEKRRAQERLEALLMEGIESGEATDFTEQDWEDIREEALRELEARRSRKSA